MRKILVALLAIAFIAGVSQAANFNSIGFIDVQKVFKDYKETSKAQSELGKKEESFKKSFEESQKKLEKAEKDGKKPEELEKMKKELEEKLAPERETLLRLNAELTGKLQQEILKAVQKVAKKVGIEMVLDKQVIITGGMDLTEMVVTELNK
ncbi:MAG: OmpH family outer membrane protein [Candidatus Margulisbacteria bacterium]|jgi:outer membrane protein|nr:OmpH family outer membrane protein [Candidatus Margulisiibacteriota bacterium]